MGATADRLRGRIDVARTGRRARRRVLDSFAAVLQAAVAAALAWLIAHRLLGHPQPFFAPIAAAISLSTSHIQRSRRIAQMVAGVLLGIVVAELLTPLLGVSTAALGVIVLVTMLVTIAVGVGFFGDGMMFPNQAAASAVLVVAVHKHGTGAERAVDVLVGGAVALILGVGLFPAQPMSVLSDAESDVLRTLAAKLGEVVDILRAGRDATDEWTLADRPCHPPPARGARPRAGDGARQRARGAAPLPPSGGRRRRGGAHRTRRSAGQRRAQPHPRGHAALRRPPGPAPALRETIAALAEGLSDLAAAERPWPPALLADVQRRADDAIALVGERPVDPDQVVASILRAAARDLVAVIELPALAE